MLRNCYQRKDLFFGSSANIRCCIITCNRVNNQMYRSILCHHQNMECLLLPLVDVVYCINADMASIWLIDKKLIFTSREARICCDSEVACDSRGGSSTLLQLHFPLWTKSHCWVIRSVFQMIPSSPNESVVRLIVPSSINFLSFFLLILVSVHGSVATSIKFHVLISESVSRTFLPKCLFVAHNSSPALCKQVKQFALPSHAAKTSRITCTFTTS